MNFEGVWGAGVATSLVNVDDVPLGTDNKSWILTSDGTTMHNGQIVDRVKEKVSEGSIVVSVYSSIYWFFGFSIVTLLMDLLELHIRW